MKFIEKLELIVKLKEKIAEAQTTDATLAAQLESLLNKVISNPHNSPAI